MPTLLTLSALAPEDQTCRTGKRKQAAVCLNTHQTAATRSCSTLVAVQELAICNSCIQRRPQQRYVSAPHKSGCYHTATVPVQTFCGWRAACKLYNKLFAERSVRSLPPTWFKAERLSLQVLKRAGKKALGGGLPGAAAMGIQVLPLSRLPPLPAHQNA